MNETFFYTQTVQAVLDSVESTQMGLREEEVVTRRARSGWNELPTEKMTPVWVLFVRQLLNPLMIILLVAVGMSAVFDDWVDVWVIIGAIVLNTFVGFFQEYKASRALTGLQTLLQPLALVRRNGREVELLARELVVGDLLFLQTGDQVTADVRLMEAVDLQINEAPLTGESLPVEKHVAILQEKTSLAERSNMVFAGTGVVAGHALGVVVATGLNSQIGLIARLISSTQDPKTPLQKQLSQLAQWIAILVVALVCVLFFIGILTGRDARSMLEVSVALAVAAIPEGLAVSVTIILAIGMQRILKRKSLVRHLVAAETLGSVSVICTDKTGTITQGNMQVVSLITTTKIYPVSDLTELNSRSALVNEILDALVLCNDGKRADGKEGQVLKGTPTEQAMLGVALSLGIDPIERLKQFPRVGDLPFDSSRKFRLTQHQAGSSWKSILIGASSKVYAACEMTSEERVQFEQIETEHAKNGFRLMTIAVKTHQIKPQPPSPDDLDGFTCLGLIALQDPLRPDVRAQVETVRQAGIRTVMVTGDHPQTAQTIARQAGIFVAGSEVVTGPELDAWTDEELDHRITHISVFARVEPRHKIRIVSAWQRKGEVVAMTGDGVNDAPALKAADIGIVVGTGTEVAKQAADLVLLDNRFATITAAVEEGRVIFDNIRKSVAYLMTDSFTEIILIAGSLLIGLPIPLLPAQILWINLIADSLPNAGLTLEPGEKDVMSLPPRRRTEPVLNKEMVMLIFTVGIVTDLLLFVLYFWLVKSGEEIRVIRSILFAAVGIDSLIYIFAMKSFRRSLFRTNPFSNLWLVGGVAIGLALMLLAIIHPFFQSIFDVSPLTLFDWLLLLMIGTVKLVAIEAVKEWRIWRKTGKKNKGQCL